MHDAVCGLRAKRRERAVGMCAVLGAIGLALVAPPAWAAFPGANGKIAFTASRSVSVMNPDGSGQTPLFTDARNGNVSAFSADGSKIVFTSSGAGSGGIFVMNADGSQQTRLTSAGDARVGAPVFSPDGSKIAFSSAPLLGYDLSGSLFGPSVIYVMNADGSGQTRLGDARSVGYGPVFSPDGSKIAFTSTRDEYGYNTGISVMNADGSAPTQLTATVDNVSDRLGSFSPDGSKIAFTRGGFYMANEIYVMNADGSGQTRLGGGSSLGYGPVYSPDGSKIAFTSGRDVGPSADVYVMNADGSAPQRLTAVGAGTDIDSLYGAIVTDWAAVISTGPGVLAPGAPGTTPARCPTPTSPSVRCYRNQRGRLVMAGTALDERFVGTDAGDDIVAFAGNDIVAALGSDDVVYGGPGNDRLVGGTGNDVLKGNSGDDSLAGVAGNDRLRGDDGNDILSGGAGHDHLTGNAGLDRLSGGAGGDRLSGGPARDRLNCGTGRDRALNTRGDHIARDCERR
jgi:TolB protein